MPGLDPGIHGRPTVQISGFRTGGDAWMPGSSPGMTVGKDAFTPTPKTFTRSLRGTRPFDLSPLQACRISSGRSPPGDSDGRRRLSRGPADLIRFVLRFFLCLQPALAE